MAEIDAVKESVAKILAKLNPVYDTIDEEGNVVEESDEVNVAFSAASGALQTRSGGYIILRLHYLVQFVHIIDRIKEGSQKDRFSC